MTAPMSRSQPLSGLAVTNSAEGTLIGRGIIVSQNSLLDWITVARQTWSADRILMMCQELDKKPRIGQLYTATSSMLTSFLDRASQKLASSQPSRGCHRLHL